MRLHEALRSTALRWATAIALTLVVQGAMLSLVFWWQTAAQAKTTIQRDLVADCRRLAALPQARLLDALDERLSGDVHRNRYVAVFKPDGSRVMGNVSALPHLLDPDGRAHLVELQRSEPRGLGPDDAQAVACPLAAGGTLLLAHDLDDLNHLRGLVLRAIGLSALPAVLLALLGGVALSVRAQVRVQGVRLTTERIIAGQLRERLPVRGSRDAFDLLSLNVNRMLDRIEELMAEVRAVGDDIAHELRTPLTRLRAGLERGCEEAGTPEEIRAVGEKAMLEIDQALSIIVALLRIREIEQVQRRSHFQAVDLEQIVRTAMDLYGPNAEAKSLTLRLSVERVAPFAGDPDLLMEAVANLIDNAIKFTGPGGHVQVNLSPRAEGGATIIIADDGPGIRPDERDAVLNRFHRASSAARLPGHGLGLSLVAAITKLHGFELKIDGGEVGCTVTIIVPRIHHVAQTGSFALDCAG